MNSNPLYQINNTEKTNYKFGPCLPDIDYLFNKKTLWQIFARRTELKKHFSNIDLINKLLWLWFWINDKEFEYLCAYFLEREFWYITDFRGWFQDNWIDISGIIGTKNEPKYIAAQCKQWNTWNINEKGIATIYEKMSFANNEHNAQLIIATTNYLSLSAWDFAESKMLDVWDYRTIIDYYNRYFFDPNAWWEEFNYFINKKERLKLINKQNKELANIETKNIKEKIIIERGSNINRFEILREIRKNEAKKFWISPGYVFSDVVLHEMVNKCPKTKSEFLCISGIWEEKYDKHCWVFAEAIRNFID